MNSALRTAGLAPLPIPHRRAEQTPEIVARDVLGRVADYAPLRLGADGERMVKALSLFSVSAKSAWQHGMVNLLGAGPLIAQT